MNWGKILGLVIPLLSAIPTLIQGVESLWSGTPKSGAEKWISVETSLSNSIQLIAKEVVAAVPNMAVDNVADKAAIWAKAVNDATVQFFNETGLLNHPNSPATPIPGQPIYLPVRGK